MTEAIDSPPLESASPGKRFDLGELLSTSLPKTGNRKTARQRFDAVRSLLVAVKQCLGELEEYVNNADAILAVGSNEPTSPSAFPEDLLTPKQTAHVLGVTEFMLRSWRELGTPQLPYIKLTNRSIRYKRGDLDAFIAGSRIQPGPGPDSAALRNPDLECRP